MVLARDVLEHHLFRFIADTLVLDLKVEEGLGAEVILLKLRDNHRASA